MRILVAGANGFLGSHVVAELARHDAQITALVLPGSESASVRLPDVRIVEADVTDRTALAPLLHEADFVVNALRLVAPGHSGAEYEAINVGSVTALLDAALDTGLSGFLQLSSIALYGHTPPNWPVDESQALRPTGPAQHSRADAERAARTYRRRVPLVILRVAFPFGPRGDGAVDRFLLRSLQASGALLAGGGRAGVSLAYGPDIGRAVWATIAGIDESRNGIFHIKSFDSDWRSLAQELAALLERPTRLRTVPYRLAQAAAALERIAAGSRRTPRLTRADVDLIGRPHLIDDSRLRAATGFRPLFTQRAALRQTVDWLRQERPDLGL